MPSYASVIPTAPYAPAYYWRCDEAAGHFVDEIAGANLTVQSGVVRGEAGALNSDANPGCKLPYAVANQWLYASFLNFDTFTAGLTIEVWFRQEALDADAPLVALFVTDGSTTDMIRLRRVGSTSTVRLEVWDNTTNTGFDVAGVLTSNDWLHLVAVIPAGTAGASVTGSVYRNGVLMSSGAVDVPRAVTRGRIRVGHDGVSVRAAGWYDELAIYKVALTEAQLLWHYAVARNPRVPLVQAHLAFDAPTVDLPSLAWVDVTEWLLSATWNRGRSMELDRFEAGSATLVLNNTTRRFEPEYSAGPYYPNLRPRVQVRLRASWNFVLYDLWYGFVEEWAPSYPGVGDGITTVQCYDALGVLGRLSLTSSFAQQLASARIDSVLTAVGWPALRRALETARYAVRAEDVAGVFALPYLQEVADAELGIIFANRLGQVEFHNGQRRYDQVHAAVMIVFDPSGDGVTAFPYLEAPFTLNDRLLVNQARVTREGGVEQVVNDTASQATNFTVVRSITGTKNAEDDGALRMATRLVVLYRTPRLRPSVVALDPIATPNLWAPLLQLEVADRVQVVRRPPGGGSAVTSTLHVEGVDGSFIADGGDVSIGLAVSPADTTQYWVVGDATYGVVGSTTRVGY